MEQSELRGRNGGWGDLAFKPISFRSSYTTGEEASLYAGSVATNAEMGYVPHSRSSHWDLGSEMWTSDGAHSGPDTKWCRVVWCILNLDTPLGHPICVAVPIKNMGVKPHFQFSSSLTSRTRPH